MNNQNKMVQRRKIVITAISVLMRFSFLKAVVRSYYKGPFYLIL